MERIGDDNQGRGLYYMEAAIDACEGAPVTIERGAVVKMAEALEEIVNDGFHHSDGLALMEQAHEALLAYYGDTNHGENR